MSQRMVAIATAIAVTVTVACGTGQPGTGQPGTGQPGTGDGPDELAAAVERTRAERHGRYVERRMIAAGESVVLWVDYDLDAGFQDIRVGVVEPGAEAPTRGEADLRFILCEGALLMWNPGVEEACGTPWVDLPPRSGLSGLGIDATAVALIEPLDIVEAHVDEAVRRGDGHFEVPVSADRLVPPSQALLERPQAVEALAGETVVAEVRLDDGYVSRVEADPSAALVAALGLPEVEDLMRLTWELSPGTAVEAPPTPPSPAPASCMDP